MHWALSGAVPARPAAVAMPTTVEAVAEVVARCHEHGIPVTASGGRSGVCGGAVPLFGGIALDLRGLAGIRGVDEVSGVVDVAAGTWGDTLEEELQARHGLTIGHWPQSIQLSTVGGWVACRSAGQYSNRYGKIEDIVLGLEVVLADGSILQLGTMNGTSPRAATGPDLCSLFVGSEGVLGIITAAHLRARPRPIAERRAAWTFPSFEAGLEALRRTFRRSATPAVARLYDEAEARRLFDADARALLIALDEGDPCLVDATMTVLAEECAAGSPFDDAAVAHWLTTRNDVAVLEAAIRAGAVVDTIEVLAPWSELPDLYRRTIDQLQRIEGTVVASAHASHLYPESACLYFTFGGINPGAADSGWSERFYRQCWDTVMHTTSASHGAISHHHGIGLQRAPYLRMALGRGFSLLEQLKQALDPKGILNPGKLGLATPFGQVDW